MKSYWQDLEQLKKLNNNVKGKEEKDGADISLIDILDKNANASRRDFLKFFGFSVVGASVISSCKKPVTKAIPYLVKPETITPGKAEYYASTFYDGEQYASILVKVRDGRPIKIEGNDLSSLSDGSSTAITQASVLELYDENRVKQPLSNGQIVSWDKIDSEILRELQVLKSKNGKIVLLSSSIISPSTFKVIELFSKNFADFKHVMYDPVSVGGILEANQISFDKRVVPDYRFDRADVIVSFGADFLGNWISPLEFTKGYATKRRLDDGQKTMSRHIQVESGMSLTGSNADERITIKPSEEKAAIANLYNALLQFAGESNSHSEPVTTIDTGLMARELWSNRGKSLVVSGSNDVDIQVLVNAINDILGSYNSTIDILNPILTRKGNDNDLAELVGQLNDGEVSGLLIYNANPVYDYPNQEEFKNGLAKVPLKISMNGTWDETSELMNYICPDSHFLESWDDSNPRKDKYSLAQPAIQTIFDTRQAQESLLAWSGESISYLELIKEHWKNNFYASAVGTYLSFDDFWNKTLQRGVYDAPQKVLSFLSGINKKAVSSALQKMKSTAPSGVEIQLYENNTVGSGKHTNNPWLQETPDALSKVVWDNYVAISPKFADEQSLETGDVVLLNGKVEAPVLVQPGQKYGVFSMALGYGRTKTGKAGKDVGFNAYPFVSIENGFRKYSGSVTFKKIEKKYTLALTQTHNSMEGRAIIREANFEEYISDPAAGNEMHEKVEHHLESLYEKHEYEGHHWGMSVDLNSCIGCNACVVGCTAENNVPVVGKKEVSRVHEMHWIRIDRYYSGDPENPEVLKQPVMCQHCDNAPCENVCPVAATTHSSEGVNQMAYNRCIGTRYCNNNCPYKVRRFNWFDYNKADALPGNTMDPVGMSLDLPRMVLNPDVTVRAKGVMEKCSFCIQRIQEKKLQAKLDGRALADGEIKTACQQACPTHAITFGDMNNKNSRVTKLMKDKRNYHLLEELHTLPSVGYLTKIRNKKS